MRFASLFSGVGGFDLGFERAGMECAVQVEIDAKCQKVLSYYWPDVARYEDIRTVTLERESVDVACGGFPCQDVSVAGRRKGLAGERSGLWFEFHRILAETSPRWAVIENVPGLLSSNGGRDFATILQGLVELGYGTCWRILDAQYFGVAQRRRRVFIVGHLGDGCAAEVLFECEGGARDSAAGGETGEGIAGVPANMPRVSGTVSSKWATGTGGPAGDECYNLVTCFEPRYARNGRGAPGHGVPPLKAQSGQTGKGDGAPVVAYNRQSGGDVRHSFGKPMLTANQTPAIGVRRLTPTECERLQGFPDDWTLVDGMSDTARYRMMGNAVCVPVAEWIGRRLIETERRTRGGTSDELCGIRNAGQQDCAHVE